MNKKDLYKSFYQEYQKAFKTLKENDFTNYFYDQFLAGEVLIYQKNISETKNFDEEWIRTLESYFPSLNKIIADPKTSLKYEEEVVIIEKARKITAQSVRHLAANTHNIRDIKDGMVIPKKILTTYPEVQYGTYENRLIMTLIDKLFYFVRHRYEIIKTNVESFQTKHFNLQSKFPFNKTEVSYNLEIKLKEDLDDKTINEYNLNLLKRVEQLNKLVTSFKQSSFMENMKNEKKVYPPLIKSNIIMKNVDYHNAYLLWLFLDRYTTLAYDVDILEKDLTFDEEYLNDVYQTSLINFLTVSYNQENREALYDLIKDKAYKRKAVRVVKKDIDSLIETPEPFEVEDTIINEYYLEKYKELFSKAVSYHETQTKSYETALKRALRETLQITNALYESFFELNEEEDIFRRLIKEPDPLTELNDAKEKAIIATMIREVKEVDYKESLKLERSLHKKIASLDLKLIEASKKRKLITSKKMRDESELKLERELSLRKEKALLKELANTKKYDQEAKELRDTINKDIKLLQDKLKEEEKTYLDNLSKTLAKETKLKLKELDELLKKKELDLIMKQNLLINTLKKDKVKEEVKLKDKQLTTIKETETKLRTKTQEDYQIKAKPIQQKIEKLEKELQSLDLKLEQTKPKALKDLPYTRLVIMAKDLGINTVSNYPKHLLINLINEKLSANEKNNKHLN